MKNLEEIFKRRTIEYEKLVQYGFSKIKNKYYFSKKIMDNQFEIIIEISEKEKFSKIVELDLNEEFALVDVESAVGEFVGKIRFEYEKILNEIVQTCSKVESFTEKQSKEIIKYIREKYNDELEFLWEDYDGAAVRNKNNKKWYVVFMKIMASKLVMGNEKEIEIIDVRYEKGKVDEIVDGKNIFPGYHMNKNSWITIVLDGKMNSKDVETLIDNSFIFSGGNKSEEKIEGLSKKVYLYLRTIPKGKVVTYGQIAKYLGNKGLARIVGTILHNNPDGEKNPCYKVVNGKGELAEAFVFGGINYQKELLEKDGIEVVNNRVDLKKYQWRER